MAVTKTKAKISIFWIVMGAWFGYLASPDSWGVLIGVLIAVTAFD